VIDNVLDASLLTMLVLLLVNLLVVLELSTAGSPWLVRIGPAPILCLQVVNRVPNQGLVCFVS